MPELNNFEACLEYARSATPETLTEVQKRLHPAIVELALSNSERYQIEVALKAATTVRLEDLRGDFQKYLGDRGLKKEPDSAATQLVRLAEDKAELFHDADKNAYISVEVKDHRETYRLKSSPARVWLRQLYREDSDGKSIGGQALQDALNDLEGTALFGSKDGRHGDEYEVFVRLAGQDGKVYLDLGDEDWRVVEIDAKGWRVRDHSPVKFRRPKGLLPLPAPEEGGNLSGLWRFVNIAKADRVLFLGCLVASLNASGPYPILFVFAEQGSGKTSAARFARALFDPNSAPVRSEPRDARDLMIAASNSRIVIIDNVSGIPRLLSDNICRLATGGGLTTRTLYENDEETIFDATRPVVVTGIEELATRGDLLDRAIIVSCPRIETHQRRAEAELWGEFEAAQPKLLGALLTAVSTALRNLPHTKLPELPRMADATLWVTAAESALGFEHGAFAKAFEENRAGANDLALDVSPVPGELRALLNANGDAWEGTASELQAELDSRADEKVQRQKAWPKNARSLGNALRRLAPNLREAGMTIEFTTEGSGKSKRRLIRIELQPNDPNDPNDPQSEKVRQERKEAAAVNADVTGSGDVPASPNGRQTSREEVSSQTHILDATDDRDVWDVREHPDSDYVEGEI